MRQIDITYISLLQSQIVRDIPREPDMQAKRISMQGRISAFLTMIRLLDLKVRTGANIPPTTPMSLPSVNSG